MINRRIDKLISYGLMTSLIEENDIIYVRNKILTKLGIDSYETTTAKCESVKEL